MRPILTTHQLTIGYLPPRRPPVVLAEHLSLQLHAGEIVCLLGPNGAGKTTLMRTLAGMLPPLTGSLRIMETELAALTPLERAQKLAIVLTDRLDMGLMTGYELVALGRHPYTNWFGQLTAEDEQMVEHAIAAVNAQAIAPCIINELSDGQRQKLLIARALAQATPLILLDEPTAFLDLPRRVEVMRLLRQITRTMQRAILLSTHDLDLALRTADSVWLLAADGKLYSGAPEDLILDGTFAAVFASEGLRFDAQHGTFQIEPLAQRPILLQGAGLVAHWTHQALLRAGFQPVTAPSSDYPRVVINGTPPIWTLYHQNQSHECHSVYELLRHLA
jgi:iron complex transport system ATP-binding protein